MRYGCVLCWMDKWMVGCFTMLCMRSALLGLCLDRVRNMGIMMMNELLPYIFRLHGGLYCKSQCG